MPERRPAVVAIVGPTCTGKTALSVRIAQKLNGEVIACDSRTIYKYMDIGTAKPDNAERGGIPHHMFDVVAPDQNYTVAQYKEAAGECIDQILARKHLPIVVGGTGLYARALLEGLDIPAVAPQPELRKSLLEFGEEHGNKSLFKRLEELDPATAKRLNPNDTVRVIRALEVRIVSGKPMSALATRRRPSFRCTWIGLTVDNRDFLRQAIETRMRQQIESGLLTEVRSLYDHYGSVRALVKAVNYAEFIDYFAGKLTYKQAVEECVRHNYQLSRRQLMWFKTNNEINWFEIDKLSQDEITDRVIEVVASKA